MTATVGRAVDNGILTSFRDGRRRPRRSDRPSRRPTLQGCGETGSAVLDKAPMVTRVAVASAGSAMPVNTRRRRTSSEVIRPAMVSSAASSVSPLPGSERTDNPANRLTESKVIDPRPPGNG